MKVITPESLAEKVPEMWARQYGKNGPTPVWPGVITPEGVDAAISALFGGPRTWTTPPPCSECGECTQWVLEVGEEAEIESNTAWLCKACVRKAAAMLD